MEKHYPLYSEISAEMQECLNKLYHKNKYQEIRTFLYDNHLADAENLPLLLKEVLINVPEQARIFLNDWQFVPADYENITTHSYSGAYAIALSNMEDFERAKFALYLLRRDLNAIDALGKLDAIIRYKAFSHKFWDTLLEENYLGLLDNALRKLYDWKNDVAYGAELMMLEAKIIAHGDENQVRRLARYLSLGGWKSLSTTLLKVAMTYERPPMSFVNSCLDERRQQEFAAIVEKCELPESCQCELFLEDYFDFFKIYVKARPLSEKVLRQMFIEDARGRYRDEYNKHHKIPFWTRVRYYLNF